MSAPTVSVRFNIQDLAQAMAHSHALDALPLNLNAEQWKILADFLQPLQLQ